jgi:hypothetical protein
MSQLLHGRVADGPQDSVMHPGIDGAVPFRLRPNAVPVQVRLKGGPLLLPVGQTVEAQHVYQLVAGADFFGPEPNDMDAVPLENPRV